MSLLIFSCSLNKNSKSQILAKHTYEECKKLGIDIEFCDLSDYQLPLCDGKTTYGHPDVQKINQLSKEASGIILATPIYNYSYNSTAKSLIEHVGRSWSDKAVGFLCAAGAKGSYMSIMGLANSLMLDFRCFVLPRFVYATEGSFSNDGITDNDVIERIDQFAKDMGAFTKSVQSLRNK